MPAWAPGVYSQPHRESHAVESVPPKGMQMGRKRPKLKKSGRRKIGRKKRKELHKRRKRKR